MMPARDRSVVPRLGTGLASLHCPGAGHQCVMLPSQYWHEGITYGIMRPAHGIHGTVEPITAREKMTIPLIVLSLIAGIAAGAVAARTVLPQIEPYSFIRRAFRQLPPEDQRLVLAQLEAEVRPMQQEPRGVGAEEQDLPTFMRRPGP